MDSSSKRFRRQVLERRLRSVYRRLSECSPAGRRAVTFHTLAGQPLRNRHRAGRELLAVAVRDGAPPDGRWQLAAEGLACLAVLFPDEPLHDEALPSLHRLEEEAVGTDASPVLESLYEALAIHYEQTRHCGLALTYTKKLVNLVRSETPLQLAIN